MQANNKDMSDRCDPGIESCYSQYLGENNLYGWAMSRNIPTGRFKWVNSPDKLKGNISELANEAGKSYLLEADISDPFDSQDLHNDLSFMCKKSKTNGVRNLVPNLYNKKDYVINFMALDQALSHGLVLDKIHWGTEFYQSTWLVPYIDFNTQLQTRAKNDSEKDFFKLMNSSMFGKTMGTSDSIGISSW